MVEASYHLIEVNRDSVTVIEKAIIGLENLVEILKGKFEVFERNTADIKIEDIFSA